MGDTLFVFEKKTLIYNHSSLEACQYEEVVMYEASERFIKTIASIDERRLSPADVKELIRSELEDHAQSWEVIFDTKDLEAEVASYNLPPEQEKAMLSMILPGQCLRGLVSEIMAEFVKSEPTMAKVAANRLGTIRYNVDAITDVALMSGIATETGVKMLVAFTMGHERRHSHQQDGWAQYFADVEKLYNEYFATDPEQYVNLYTNLALERDADDHGIHNAWHYLATGEFCEF